MRLSAVAIVAPFAGGILLGLAPFFASRAAHRSLLLVLSAGVLLLIVFGLVLLWQQRFNSQDSPGGSDKASWLPAALSLMAWVGLGILAACAAGQPLPAEHVLTRFAAQEIPQNAPLRWHGILRD